MADTSQNIGRGGGGGGRGGFSTCMPNRFWCPFKALSYANLSEHGSLDEMNKVKSTKLCHLTDIRYFF